MSDDSSDEWSKWWTARVAALESVLGKSDNVVGHAMIPFELGAELGGSADILYFRQHLDGVAFVTSELIGRDDQLPNDIGNYELMICHRDGSEWGSDIIGALAHTTRETPLNPGETMDIGPATPRGSTISALLFFEYARFAVLGRQAGLLLCIGITADELKACKAGQRPAVEEALKASNVYPFTDLSRPSVLKGTKSRWKLW